MLSLAVGSPQTGSLLFHEEQSTLDAALPIADIFITFNYDGCSTPQSCEVPMRRRQFLGGLAGVASCVSVGCGTMLHRERIGAPRTNHIDWKIAALDGLGLLLFFVPGVIAFVVDFQTGAIYLPPEEVASTKPLERPNGSEGTLRQIAFSREELSSERIEALVAKETGRVIVLDDSTTRVSSLDAIDGYHDQRRRHEEDRTFGSGLRAFFAKLATKTAQK
jgi:hypothetical protein